MRLLEMLAAAAALSAATAYALAPQIAGGSRLPAFALAGGAAGALLLLRAIGPFRWQMLPVELLVVTLLATLLLGGSPSVGLRIGLGVGAVVLSALAVVLVAGLPLVRLPAPDGPYAVGASTTGLIRPGDPDGPRRLIVKLWYPAALDRTAGVRREALWPEVRGPEAPLPLRLLLGYLAGVRTHTHVNAPPAPDGPFPLVIYNHALVSTPSENTLLMEALASRGFVVASVSHAEHAVERAALQGAVSTEERDRDKALYAAFGGAPDRAERARIMSEIYANSSATTEIVRHRTADAAFVLDEIDRVLAAAPDGLAIDRERVGGLGFSVGGAVATRWCMTDRRCRAAVNLDGGLFGVPEEALPAPYLMIYAAGTEGANDALKARAQGPFEEARLAGTRHMDFTDAALLWPLMKRLGVLGPARGEDVVRTKNKRVADFLDRSLPP